MAAALFAQVTLTAQASDTRTENAQQIIGQRAVQAVIWGMPAFNYDRMFQAALSAGASANQIVYWSRPSSRKNPCSTKPGYCQILEFRVSEEKNH